MRRAITILVSIALGFSIGWYCGHTRLVVDTQHNVLESHKVITDYISNYNTELTAFDKMRKEEFQTAAPWEASTASISLAALKNLDTNDEDGARARLAAMIAIYYHSHSRDGDSNLLAKIVSLAAKNTVLSNALYPKLP